MNSGSTNILKLKNLIAGANKSNKIFYLMQLMLLVFTFLWFYKLQFTTIYGDDLSLVINVKDTPFLSTTILNSGGNKYRPVYNIIQYFTLKVFQPNYMLFTYFNIFIFFIICSLIIYFFRQIKPNNLLSFTLILAFITSRFSYFYILMLLSPLESFSLLFFVCTLIFGYKYYHLKKLKHGFYLIVSYLLATFTHERYIVLAPFLIALFLITKGSRLIKKLVLVLFTVLVPVLNITLKAHVFQMRVLEGTGGTGVSFDYLRIIKFLASGFLNLLGINAGPTYLNGIDMFHVPLEINLLILFSAISVLLSFLLVLKNSSRNNKKKILFLGGFISFFLILPLLGVASITIRQELRWLYAPYIVLLAITYYLLSHSTKHRYLNTILTAVFIISTLITNNFYKQNLPNVYFMWSEKIASSMYDKTIRQYGNNLKYYKVYIQENPDLGWPLLGIEFFNYYLGPNNYSVEYVNNILDLTLTELKNGQTLALDYDPSSHEIIDVTQDLIMKKDQNLIPGKRERHER